MSCEPSFTLVSLSVPSDNHRGWARSPRRDIWGRLVAVYPGWPFSSEPQTVSGRGLSRQDRRDCLTHLPVTPAGWNKRIEYAPGAGSLALFPGIRLETCDEPLWNIQATIELQTSHVAKGCDRDNYSERALRKLCGGCAPLGTPWTCPFPPSLCLTLLASSLRICLVPSFTHP